MKKIKIKEKSKIKKEKIMLFSIKNQNDLQMDLNRIYERDIENQNYISVKKILLILKETYQSIFDKKETIENDIENKILKKFGEKSIIVIYSINNNTIELGFTDNYHIKNIKKIIYQKENDLYVIKRDDTNKGQLILNLIIDDLNKLFKLSDIYNYFHNQYNEKIRSINSSLVISISLYSINIYISNNKNLLNINYSTYEGKYYVTGIEEMTELIKGKEIELLNKIYIPIDQCPDYYKNEIYKQKSKTYKRKK